MRSVGTRILKGLAWLVLAGLVVEVYLAGAALFGVTTFQPHRALGVALALGILLLFVIDLGGGSGFSFPLVPSCALTGVGTDTLGQCVGMPGKDA